MTKAADIFMAVLLVVLAAGCQQEVISETYRPIGPSLKANNSLAQGAARTGPVLVPQVAPQAAKAPSPDVWDWLTGVFEGPDKPAPQTAPMMMPPPVQPAASIAPMTPLQRQPRSVAMP